MNRLYAINADDKQSEETHWISLFIDINAAVSFDFFQIEYIPQEVLCKINEKPITHNIFRIQSNDSIMCRFSCYRFYGTYMIVGKTLFDYTNLFSPNDYQKNDMIKYKYFKDKYGKRSLDFRF